MAGNGLPDWQRFVLDHGWRVPAHEMAAVVGQSIEDVLRLRGTGACTRRVEPKRFAELFSLWHGRAPADNEWPLPRKNGGRSTYEWQAPELALLASLVGRFGVKDISCILTNRLRKLTGDLRAGRNRNAVQVRINQIGLQTKDVVGGITIAQAGREIKSLEIVRDAIERGALRPFRVGRIWVIPHDAWVAWKAKRILPPPGYVRLSSIRQALAIRSDKLPEMAKLGYIPSAVRCSAGLGGPSSHHGTWWIDPKVAARLVADRRAGRPMPWHGKPHPSNLLVTYKLWQKRKHPASCKTCTSIWGHDGAPRAYDDYARRYPPLAHGAKRHLTRRWTPGLTIAEVARYCRCSVTRVRSAIANGALEVTSQQRVWYVSRTDATCWKARHCPTGDNDTSWLSLATASKQYLFTLAELRGFIADGQLKSKTGTAGAMRGVMYVPRHQCRQLRDKIGFTEAQAARRVGVSIPRFRRLLAGVNWRRGERIPLVTVDAVIKRLESRAGYTITEAANALNVSPKWVRERIADGAVRVSRAKWDERRLYLSKPMLNRLKTAKESPVTGDHIGHDWLRLSQAALEAGVATGTITKWAEHKELRRRCLPDGWRYPRNAVRSRARRYWRHVRFHRATPPDWLRLETRS